MARPGSEPSARPAPFDVVAGLIRKGGLFLITQRRGGQWEFPGGKPEAGETLEEALERELMEELGVSVRVGRLYLTIEHDYPDRSIILHTFFCRLLAGSPQAIDCQDLRWVKVEEMGRFDFLEADSRIVARLADGD